MKELMLIPLTLCVSINNKLCAVRPTGFDLNPEEIHYYLFMVSLDRCHGKSNALDDLSSKVCVLNKTMEL